MNKIKSINELKGVVNREKESGQKIVLCHGCFDLLHIGHLRHFKSAKKLGDILIVTITQDKYVDKGKNRPAFNENYRAEMLDAIEFIDYVAINQWKTAEQTIKELKPNYYVKGSDYKPIDNRLDYRIEKEKNICEMLGVTFKYTDEITSSSTYLLNNYFKQNEGSN